jgi:predicted TIM-barrel fold metal-dependent hydrolase
MPGAGMLKAPLPALGDADGVGVPAGFPPVVDAHVHLFPGPLFRSVWQWFDRFGWPIRHKLTADEVLRFLFSKGVSRIVALHYAHKPGMARRLNSFMADICRRHPAVCGMATVFPGEPEAAAILKTAFQTGLGGVKLHGHVQCFDLESDAMEEVYECCRRHDKPLIMHVGREPKSPAYPCDPHELYSASKLEGVLRRHPDLRICVPHLGADEFEAYRAMAAAHDNLWLDTTMTLADYLPLGAKPDLGSYRTDRLIFGSDFPNLPYAWDRELKNLSRLKLSAEQLADILGRNAMGLYFLRC